ncbi:HAD-IA family hydrolase [Arthrobacter sp. ISL-48]|uniref:HAD-IA family hydrolase n=1 Tax=Arthrobacter sp. ISL-48 TaxID=2819110 RepID=UPI001BEB5D81|nr:HAD-IA family hydrolase [Arthrobacter sp. ISL-48]MBT2533968.1 HAD-IA family hydrolase [Arthrobacter sp. ISL-48]
MRTQFDAILFDMDGTLVDSTAVVERTWRNFAAFHGLDDETVIGHAHGRPTAETVSFFIGNPELAESETARITHAESIDTDGVTEIPGAAAVLEALADQKWAVVTSAGTDVARARMKACGLVLPEVFVTVEDIKVGKPHPEGYLLACTRLGVDPQRCLVFEDAGPGIAAGLASGASVVVVGGYQGSETAGLHTISDFTDVVVEPGVVRLSQENRSDLYRKVASVG